MISVKCYICQKWQISQMSKVIFVKVITFKSYICKWKIQDFRNQVTDFTSHRFHKWHISDICQKWQISKMSIKSYLCQSDNSLKLYLQVTNTSVRCQKLYLHKMDTCQMWNVTDVIGDICQNVKTEVMDVEYMSLDLLRTITILSTTKKHEK